MSEKNNPDVHRESSKINIVNMGLLLVFQGVGYPLLKAALRP
jgi:hypothetical protein